MEATVDPSLRFFDYVMRQPGMASYLNPAGKKTVSPKKVFRFGCITAAEFTALKKKILEDA